MSDLILASGSPRRKELLAELGFSFEVISSDVEELHDLSMPLRELCEHNAKLKAQDVATRNPGKVTLGADTLVYSNATPLGKPKSLEEAYATLKSLSGGVHYVCTGLCLVLNEKVEMFSEETEVHFHTLSDETIESYLSQVNVMDKAGSYAIQEQGEMIVKSIVGSYSNVVGLPQKLVKAKIQAFSASVELELR